MQRASHWSRDSVSSWYPTAAAWIRFETEITLEFSGRYIDTAVPGVEGERRDQFAGRPRARLDNVQITLRGHKAWMLLALLLLEAASAMLTNHITACRPQLAESNLAMSRFAKPLVRRGLWSGRRPRRSPQTTPLSLARPGASAAPSRRAPPRRRPTPDDEALVGPPTTGREACQACGGRDRERQRGHRVAEHRRK